MSNYIKNNGTEPKNFFADGFLSPKDNHVDYLDPLDYITVVRESVARGELQDYTLTELKKVEKQFSQAYTSLSNEEIGRDSDTVHETLMSIVDFRQDKAEELKQMVNDAVSFLNEIIGNHDADAPENRARSNIAYITKDLAAGKFKKYSLAELKEIENKFIKSYSALPLDEQERKKEDCYKVFEDLGYLQMDTPEGYIEYLTNDNYIDTKMGLQSWKGYASPRITVEEHEMDLEELNEILSLEENSADLTLNDLLAVYNPKDFEGKRPQIYKIGSQKDNEANYTLKTLTRAKETAVQSWEEYSSNVFSPQDKVSFKAYCVTSLPAKNAPGKITEKKVIIKERTESKPVYAQEIEYDVDVSEFWEDKKPVYTTTKNLENVVVAFPTKKKSKVLSFIAKAAMVAGLGITAFTGYNYLAPSVKDAADPQLEHYHGASSAEVASSATSAKPVERSHESSVKAKSVENNSKSVIEQPAVASQTPATPKASQPKLREYPNSSWVPYESEFHTVEKGETMAGLYEDYAARGGTLSRSDYFKVFRQANPHVQDLTRIYTGQKVIDVGTEVHVQALTYTLSKLDCETLKDIYSIDDVNVTGEKANHVDHKVNELKKTLMYLDCNFLADLNKGK